MSTNILVLIGNLIVYVGLLVYTDKYILTGGVMHKAKIFMNGHSQAVRLPKELRFSTNTKEVSVIPLGNGIILQPLLKSWKEVFNQIKPTDDFFHEGREDTPPQIRKWELFK